MSKIDRVNRLSERRRRLRRRWRYRHFYRFVFLFSVGYHRLSFSLISPFIFQAHNDLSSFINDVLYVLTFSQWPSTSTSSSCVYQTHSLSLGMISHFEGAWTERKSDWEIFSGKQKRTQIQGEWEKKKKKRKCLPATFLSCSIMFE